jgi:ribosomal RNA-processing protein 12
VLQLWGLLPAVCNYPTDVPDSFKHLAKHLGTAFNDRPELRGVISSALQHLIKQSKEARVPAPGGEDASENGPPLSASVRRARAFYTPEVGAANIAAITAFTRNFLPLFFNAFVASPPEKRAGVYAAVEAFASVADPAQVRTFAETMMVKLLEATRDAEKERGVAKTPGDAAPMSVDGSAAPSPTARRCTFMELAVALTPGMDDVSVSALYRAAKPAVMDSEAPVQKKAYKLLARLCELRPAFLKAQGGDLLELLLTSQGGCHSAARRARLLCLRHVIVLMTTEGAAEKDDAISALVRKTAFDLAKYKRDSEVRDWADDKGGCGRKERCDICAGEKYRSGFALSIFWAFNTCDCCNDDKRAWPETMCVTRLQRQSRFSLSGFVEGFRIDEDDGYQLKLSC